MTAATAADTREAQMCKCGDLRVHHTLPGEGCSVSIDNDHYCRCRQFRLNKKRMTNPAHCPYCHATSIFYSYESKSGPFYPAIHYYWNCPECDNQWPERTPPVADPLCPRCHGSAPRDDSELCSSCLFADLPF